VGKGPKMDYWSAMDDSPPQSASRPGFSGSLSGELFSGQDCDYDSRAFSTLLEVNSTEEGGKGRIRLTPREFGALPVIQAAQEAEEGGWMQPFWLCSGGRRGSRGGGGGWGGGRRGCKEGGFTEGELSAEEEDTEGRNTSAFTSHGSECAVKAERGPGADAVGSGWFTLHLCIILYCTILTCIAVCCTL